MATLDDLESALVTVKDCTNDEATLMGSTSKHGHSSHNSSDVTMTSLIDFPLLTNDIRNGRLSSEGRLFLPLDASYLSNSPGGVIPFNSV